MTRKSRNSILRPRKLEGLFESMSEDESEDDIDVGAKRKRESSVPGKMEVFLRIRPTPEESHPECIHAVGPNSIAISAPEGHMGTKNAERSHIFAFSKVLQPETTNKHLFSKQFSQRVNNTLMPTCESLVVFAYGITATGKTHSMEGNREDPGIIPQTLQLLFHNKSNEEDVSISMYEIYNESIHDMLTPTAGTGKQQKLKLKEDGTGQIWIPGLSQNTVETVEEARQTYINGLSYRKHAATGMNKKSSRSHAVVLINIRNSATQEWQSSISFVDLAGSERQPRTGNAGLRLRESVAINSSLMTLGRCLEALRWNHDNRTKRKRHIPFRQAKITHAFKNAFLGSGSTVLLVNVSASAKDYEETVHVLKYASLATALPCSSQPSKAIMNAEPAAKRQKSTKHIASTSKNVETFASPEEDQNHVQDHEELLEANEELSEEVERLRSELFESERRAAEMEARIREEVAGEMSDLLREMEHSYHTRLEAEVSAARNAASAPNASVSDKDEAAADRESLEEEVKCLEMELAGARREMEAAKEANEANEHALVNSFKSLLEEETTQLKANAAMEKETLEHQLDSQRQENEALKLRLRRMKEATIATLKRYNANLSPGALTLSNFLQSPDLNEVSEGRRSAEYDVDMSGFVIKTSNLAAFPAAEGSPGVSTDEQKENLPAAQDTKKGKAKRKKSKKVQKAQPPQATPVARRTRAGRRACTVIENVN